jgi:hypothetical protein
MTSITGTNELLDVMLKGLSDAERDRTIELLRAGNSQPSQPAPTGATSAHIK